MYKINKILYISYWLQEIPYSQRSSKYIKHLSQDDNLVFYTIYIACVKFIHEFGEYQKVHSEQQIFEKLFVANLFLPRILGRKSPKKFYIAITQKLVTQKLVKCYPLRGFKSMRPEFDISQTKL